MECWSSFSQLFGEADADNDVSPETALIREEEDGKTEDGGKCDNGELN